MDHLITKHRTVIGKGIDMSTLHVHAELIKAWADGAVIEWNSSNTNKDQWEITEEPQWKPYYTYRIKPVTKPSSTSCVCNKVAKVTRWLWAFKFSTQTQWHVSSVYLTETEFSNWTQAKGIKLEWSAMEFDE